MHVVTAGCCRAADRKKRQRLAHRVIERVEQRRKGAKRPEPDPSVMMPKCSTL